MGYAVNELYIYPNNTSNWGNNLLTAPMEQSGAVLTYLSALTGGNREGMFNIQLIDSDGDIYSFSNVQIADGDALTAIHLLGEGESVRRKAGRRALLWVN